MQRGWNCALVSAKWLLACLFMGGLIAGAAVSAQAQEFRQLKLTEAQITGFIASQKDFAAFAEQMQNAGEGEEAKLQAQLDDMAKKHGFENFNQLDDVSANISFVMSGLDTETGEYVDPIKSLKEELADVRADTNLKDAEKQQLIEELEEALKTTPALEFEENIALVAKYREAIEKAPE